MNNLRYRQRDEDFAYTTPAAAMMYNLAVAFCHTGDLPRAGHVCPITIILYQLALDRVLPPLKLTAF